MIYKTSSSKVNYTLVTFELPNSLWADQVFVVGDFNAWSPHSTPLQQERDGTWRATVELPVGRQYEFLYLVNGVWTADREADDFTPVTDGLSRSVLRLS